MEEAKLAQIEDIVKRKTGIAEENIVITPLSQSEETVVEEPYEEESYEEEEEAASEEGSETEIP